MRSLVLLATMAAALPAAVLVLQQAPSLAVDATDPSLCTQYGPRTTQCNCHSCNCQTCHTCGCHINRVPWTDCTFDSCGDSGCWCSPVCPCCYDSACTEACNCETCCDECTETVCTNTVSYAVHEVEPVAVPATDAAAAGASRAVVIEGGFFVAVGDALKCRFGDTVVAGQYISNNEVSCTPPERADVASGSAAQVAVAVSLDGGTSWTVDDLQLTMYACPAPGGGEPCSGNGSCDPTSGQCLCSSAYVGEACDEACPVGGPGLDQVCSGHGSCGRGSAQAVCTCDAGFWGPECGEQCDLGIDDVPCSGTDHGLCSPSTGECVCLQGFAGSACEHIGTCTDHGIANCTCAEPGYYGDGCTSTCPATSNCEPGTGCSVVCSGAGLCTREGDCLCDAGYYGTGCESECPGGAATPCAGHGACHVDGTCTCEDAWWGPACDKTCPGGEESLCSGHGECDHATGVCVCTVNFFGTDCSTTCPSGSDGQVCNGQGVCRAGGTCECLAGSFGAACDQMCPGEVTVGASRQACSGHGVCSDSGECVCGRGWYDATCDSECPGGASNPCSGHGLCDASSGQCNCDPGYWGATCDSSCPTGGEHGRALVCSNHGACDATTGTCLCNPPYSGDVCDTLTCQYGCYGHGECQSDGTCQCNDAWTGDYCSEPKPVPVTDFVASVFQFIPEEYHFASDVGTVFVNVSRTVHGDGDGGGSGAGEEAYVSYATLGFSAEANVDFLPASGRLVWGAGDAAPVKQIEVEILYDDAVEGLELFEVVLFDPSPRSRIQGRNASVLLDAHGDLGESVEITVQMSVDASAIQPGTEGGSRFASDFAAEVSTALGVSASRIIVTSVLASSGGARVTFVLQPAPQGSSEPEAAELAATFVEMMKDSQGALYQGQLTAAIDIDFEPLVRVDASSVPHGQQNNPTSPGTPDGGGGMGATIALIAIVALIAVGAGVAYWKRVPLSEWLLWRLGNFRFRRFRDHEGGDGISDDDDGGDGVALPDAPGRL